MKTKTYLFLILLSIFPVFFSCVKSTHGTEDKPVNGGNVTVPVSIMADYSVDSQITFEMESDADWELMNTHDWCSFSPVSGQKGKHVITMTVIHENSEISEREGLISFKCGDNIKELIIYQKGKPGLKGLPSEYNLGFAQGVSEISVVSNSEFSVDVKNTEWLKIKEIKKSEPELLSDGVTYSQVLDARIIIEVTGMADAPRQAELEILSGNETYKVILKQVSQPIVDWSKDFYRASLAMCFTATWCGFCPTMKRAIEIAMDRVPDRIVPFNLHPSSSSGGLGWDKTSEYEDEYKAVGYPHLLVNNLAQVPLQDNASKTGIPIKALVDESIESYPSKFGIAAVSDIIGNLLNLQVRIAPREAVSGARLYAFLLEDGISYEEKDYDNVVRMNITEMSGMPLEDITARSVCDKTFSVTLSDNISEIKNCHLVIYISRPYTQDVHNVEDVLYQKSDYIFDNVIISEFGKMTEFKYE